jgi:glycosyltransferase involved in cell wall biosynthesis
MKILINTPRLNGRIAGVVNHYAGLKNYWTENVRYNQIGKKSTKPGAGLYWIPIDVVCFIFRLLTFNPDIVLVNPSLGKNAVKRDLMYIRIARFFGKKTAVFFHGFNINNAKTINIKKMVNQLNRCECILVLSQQFANHLKDWGITIPIHTTTTKVEDKQLEGFEIGQKDYSTNNILYLARVSKEKGIFTTLDTFKILQERCPELRFRIAGVGHDLEDAKKYAKENGIKAEFLGGLSGQALIDEFKNAYIYIFTSFHEGMPTSVLEAMAFGLPVTTTPVGGLVDFFKNGEMGYMIDSFNAADFANAIENLVNDKEKVKKMSITNYKFAQKRFLASSVARMIEQTLKKYI